MPKFEITTMIGCSLMCSFCPQDKLLRAYKDPVRVMSFESFRTAIDKLPAEFEIVFAGYTEPWLNNDCTDFVEYAFRQQRKVSIYSTLYNMTPRDVDRLIDLFTEFPDQLTQFWIHLPDTHGNMKGWKNSDNYEYALTQFRTRVRPNLMTMDTDGQVHQDLEASLQPAQWYLHTRANNLDVQKISGQKYHEAPRYEFVVECTRDKDFTSNVMLPNGDLALCCMDYGLKHIIGNILAQSYDEIRNGQEIEKIKRLNQTLAYTDEVLCKGCNDGHCRTPWNDEQVLERVKQEAPEILGL
jgi:hypothetical protein